jgi:hypothetical protein
MEPMQDVPVKVPDVPVPEPPKPKCSASRGFNDTGEIRCTLDQGHAGPHVGIKPQDPNGGPERRGWYDDSPRT